jgi:purine-nucleoside phosphorylase
MSETASSTSNLATRIEKAAKYVLEQTALRPRIGLVLGSGLGKFADELLDPTRIPYGSILHFPTSTAIGHASQLVIGILGKNPIAVMQGRVHSYEGYSPQEVTFPIRVFGKMGVGAVVLTNAAGGVNPQYKQGQLVIIRDHINLQGQNPLVGLNDDTLGPRFPDMTQAYYKPYREIAREESARLGLNSPEGVYAAMLGPSYETPAEIRFLMTIGADLVGMSTVPEVIVARQMGLRVLALSCVTNMAAGVLDQPLSHKEVLEVGARVQNELIALLKAVTPRIAEDLERG